MLARITTSRPCTDLYYEPREQNNAFETNGPRGSRDNAVLS
jgi:hypothetical protein